MPTTFAIGDIHGHAEKLDAQLAACQRYHDTRAGDDQPPRFVFLGDYVDRGPDSKGVIDRIIGLRKHGGCEVVTLMGNHEQMMLGALHHRHPAMVQMFMTHGGMETIDSYGSKIVEGFAGHLKDFFPHLKLFYDDGRRFFVHAGVDHALPLHTQSDTTMLWGGGCTNVDIDPGRFVVHGHIVTPVAVPGRHHINIDTGAYAGGPLTAAVFNGETTLPIAIISDENGMEWEF